ncbi:Pentatricopeptide repeat-containing protein [Cynara cardunculus var. scolymus]|uniref:Pentatricopeptide repeat-containing protein n=1 Tax=Cynara cardunculus var. scolymus TaxID=59895 RepID=A0A103YE45_CYNCS|nr:Pentatricopeptide repeat-containing protein [Cynara cardunculus var. scolymus]
MPRRNLISWTTLISSYSQMGMAVEALDCFRSMVIDGFVPNHYTYVSALSASASLGVLRIGKEIHARIIRFEEKVNSFVENSLVNFYGKCGMLSNAISVFDGILEPNEVSWTSLVSCACHCGENLEGLKIFSRSHKAGVMVNEFASASVLGACATVENTGLGMQVHSHAVKSGTRLDQFVVTGLVNLYAKCGDLGSAQRAFWEVDKPHLTAWTALMGGCVQQGKGKEATDLFRKLHASGDGPNERTFATVLGAFLDVKEIDIGKQLHSLILKLGYISFTFVGNAIMDFYFKSGFLDGGLKVFEEMNEHDVVTWNALISGHMNLGCYEEAVKLLREMLLKGFELNLYSYSSILNICGDLPAIEWGKQTHCCIIKLEFDSNVVVGSALINMYAKCGRLSNARVIFDNFPSKNTVSWNTMLMGYAHHGHGKEALEIYDMMLDFGVKPNSITFIGALSACGHSGLLEDGLRHFRSMTKDYGITPKTDHLACMVNLFSRKGQTKLAFDFITSFPTKPDKVVWRCLLSGCKTSKDFDLGKYAAEKILDIDPDDVSAHIMLSNIYAESKMWNEIAKIRKLMKEKVLKKDTGYSWTELKNKTYSFSSGRDANSDGNCVSEVLTGLTEHLIDEGYVPSGIV